MARKAPRVSDTLIAKAMRDALAHGLLDPSDSLRALRALNGWAQSELASLAGVNLKVVRDIEARKGNPGLSSLSKIANATGLRLAFASAESGASLMDPGSRQTDKQDQREADFALVRNGAVSQAELDRRNGLALDNVRYRLPRFA